MNRDFLRACSPTLHSLLGEDVGSDSTCSALRLPPIITATGFNGVLDLLFSWKGSADVLLDVTKSLDPSRDEFCKAAVDVLVAADFLGVPSELVDTVGELVMQQCAARTVNSLQVFSLLNHAGSQTAFQPLLERLKRHVSGNFAWHFTDLHTESQLLCSAVLTSEELAELLRPFLSRQALTSTVSTHDVFKAVLLWYQCDLGSAVDNKTHSASVSGERTRPLTNLILIRLACLGSWVFRAMNIVLCRHGRKCIVRRSVQHHRHLHCRGGEPHEFLLYSRHRGALRPSPPGDVASSLLPDGGRRRGSGHQL